MSRKRIISPKRRRRVAEHLTVTLVALQATLLLALAITPTSLPPRITLFELLWAAARKPSFFPLLALMIGGPVLTVLACQVPGRHRPWIFVAWTVFLVVLVLAFGDRVALMLRVIWWQIQN